MRRKDKSIEKGGTHSSFVKAVSTRKAGSTKAGAFLMSFLGKGRKMGAEELENARRRRRSVLESISAVPTTRLTE